MFFQHFLADEIADTCAEESANHFDDTAAQQEGESTAGKSRSQPQIESLVVTGHILYLVKDHVELLCGVFSGTFSEAVSEGFHSVDLVGIDAGGIQ